jgi:Tol biopolymer transport system component
MNADGSNIRILTPPQLTAFQPDWSPDGQKITFSTNSNFSTILDEEIWTIRVDGTRPMRLTDNNKRWNGYLKGRHDFTPSWSPQGDRIAFERDAPDFSHFAIYVIAPDGSGPVTVFEGTSSRGVPNMKSRMRGAMSGRAMFTAGASVVEHGGFSPRWGPAPKQRN